MDVTLTENLNRCPKLGSHRLPLWFGFDKGLEDLSDVPGDAPFLG
jgi:hypothetical protein